MNINIACCIFGIETIKSNSIKKSNIKKLKILVNKKTNRILEVPFSNKKSLRLQTRDYIKEILGTTDFHIEQVYTLGDEKFYKDKKIDIIHIGLVDINAINKLDSHYQFVDLEIKTNEYISQDNKIYKYKTTEYLVNDSMEYFHEIDTQGNLALEKSLLEILITYKYLKNRVVNTNVIFNLMPKEFTLEEVKLTYELIREEKVDKSNFRKKYSKYCEKVNGKISDKGYRPAQLFKFNNQVTDAGYR